MSAATLAPERTATPVPTYAPPPTSRPPRERLLSLDVFRGMTIAGMLLVNNPGSWGAIYPPLEHAAWHGWTPTDLIFPFFLFIVGITTHLSLEARRARGDDDGRARPADRPPRRAHLPRGSPAQRVSVLHVGRRRRAIADPTFVRTGGRPPVRTGASWACCSASGSRTSCAALLSFRTTLKQQVAIIAVAAVRILVRDDAPARAA